jgi:competence protein ComEC
LLLGCLVGVALQLQQPVLWAAWTYTLGAVLAGLLLVWGARSATCQRRAQHQRWATLLAWCVALGLGAVMAWGMTGWRATVFTQQALAPALEGQDLRVTALVAAMPQADASGVRLRLAVESAHLLPTAGRRAKRTAPQTEPDASTQVVTLPPMIDVAWYGGMWAAPDGTVDLQRAPQPVRAGERWEMTVRLKAPHGTRNPHGFDYELWMWEQGVQATGYVRAGPRDSPPRRLAATWRYPIEHARQRVRDAIVQRLAPDGAATDDATQRVAGVVAALVTGDQRAIDRTDWELFRATGVAHLMSISGLHITLFAWLAAAMVGLLWRRSVRLCLRVPAPHAVLLAGVALAGAYALFSGWGVPAQRTVLMLACVAVLRWSGRLWPWPQVWLLVAAVVVLADPWALWQPGFWLSFVAVGILFATNSVADSALSTKAYRHFYALLREQWVLTLALTPLTLLLFGQVSLVGLLANLVAIPWVTLVVTPLALGGVLLAPLWQAAAWALQPLVLGLQWLADLPGAVVFVPAAPVWAGAAALVGGLLLAMRWPWPVRLLGLPLLLPVLWWQPQRPAPGQFDVLAADIGQGNAVLVRTAQHSLLYDAGPQYGRGSDAGQRVVVPLLRALGEQLDTVVLSHRDTDHTGGATAVLAQQPGATLRASLEPTHPLQALRLVQPCIAGQQWQWDGVTFTVLHPTAADVHAAYGAVPNSPSLKTVKPNTLSCVVHIQGQGGSALLAGDVEAAQEQALLQRHAAAVGGMPLAADVLLVPHHGSKTSSTPAFLDVVQPRTALVQAGYRNRFGHPAPEVAQRYTQRGIALVESAACGAAHWSSATPAHVRCERAADSRYWQHQPVPNPHDAAAIAAPLGEE